MNISAYKLRDLQNTLSLLEDAEKKGLAIGGLITVIHGHINADPHHATPSNKRRSDNIETCSVCGKPAVIIPLSHVDRTLIANHAIQCQNRPATDQPWQDGMCGHTEYIMRGDK